MPQPLAGLEPAASPGCVGALYPLSYKGIYPLRGMMQGYRLSCGPSRIPSGAVGDQVNPLTSLGWIVPANSKYLWVFIIFPQCHSSMYFRPC